MTEEELQNLYAKWPDAKLLQALANEEDYTPMAISIIKTELKTRNVTPEESDRHYNIAKAKREKRYITIDFDQDLNPWLKAFFYFLFKVPFATTILRNGFREKGQLLMLNQSRYYSFFGVVALMLSLFVSVDADGSAFSFFGCWFSGFILALCYDLVFNRQRYIEKLKKEFPEGKAILDREML